MDIMCNAIYRELSNQHKIDVASALYLGLFVEVQNGWMKSIEDEIAPTNTSVYLV